MEVAWTSETLVSYIITRRQNPEDLGYVKPTQTEMLNSQSCITEVQPTPKSVTCHPTGNFICQLVAPSSQLACFFCIPTLTSNSAKRFHQTCQISHIDTWNWHWSNSILHTKYKAVVLTTLGTISLVGLNSTFSPPTESRWDLTRFSSVLPIKCRDSTMTE